MNKTLRHGYIYEYKSPSNKYYIGQTIALSVRKSSHKRMALRNYKKKCVIDRALAKYGYENFTFTIILHICSYNKARLVATLNALEYYYIRKYRKEGKILYNVLDGGGQSTRKLWTDSLKQKQSLWLKSRWLEGTFSGKTGIPINQDNLNKMIEKRVTPVIQLTKNNEIIAEYKSIHDASRKTGISVTSINNNTTGRSKTAGGYIWKYATDKN